MLVDSTLSLRLTTIRPHTEKCSAPEGIGAANGWRSTGARSVLPECSTPEGIGAANRTERVRPWDRALFCLDPDDAFSARTFKTRQSDWL
jgi:hypothetical protein